MPWLKQVRFYQNGSLVTFTSYSATVPSSLYVNTDDLVFGWQTGLNRYITAYMDEFAFWNRALTSTEITQLYNSGSGLQYPFTTSGWTGKINGVTDPSKINGIEVANISKVNTL